MRIQTHNKQEDMNVTLKRHFKRDITETQGRDNGVVRQHLRLTRHVLALDLSHESQDVPGGVLGAEHMVLPLLDGREVRLCGCALQEVGEVLVKHILRSSLKVKGKIK